jgi:glycosyltransferase involved in cell wall biosynthesis
MATAFAFPHRIAIISANSWSFTNYATELMADLLAGGVKVFALAPHDEKGRAALRAQGVEPIDISLSGTGINPIRDAIDLAKLTRTLAKLKVDTAFAYFTKPLIYGSMAAAIARVPHRYAKVSGAGFVFTSNGPRQHLLRPILRALFRISLRSCDRVFFENTDDLKIFEIGGMVRKGSTQRVFGSGVNLERFTVAPLPSDPSFIMVGRLNREKGVSEYLEAARALKAKYPSARFALLGGVTNNPGSFTRAEIEQMTAGGAVQWIDHVDDVRPHLAAHSVFVLPSYREGLPCSTLEAMAMGRAVVTTDVTGCRDTVEGNGFLVPPRDSVALADAMERFIADPALARRMGAESRRIVETQFDVRLVNASLIEGMAANYSRSTGGFSS